MAGRALIEVDKTVAERIAEARVERDRGLQLAQAGDRTGWDSALIDQAIDALAATGRPFSANDLRPFALDVPGPLIGKRFEHASRNRRVITHAGFVESDQPSTHCHPIRRWIGISPEEHDDA